MIRFAENLNKMIAAGLGGALEAPRTEVAVGHRVIYTEASGAVVNFESNVVAPVKNLRVTMEPIQAGSGDPSPENIRPISGRTAVNVWDDPAYGGTIAWNQLAKPVASDYWSAENNVSVAFTDSVATFTSQTANNGIKSSAQKQVAASHVYYIGFSFQSESASTITFFYGGNGGVRVSFTSETSMTGVYKIAKADAPASGASIYLFPASSGVNVEHKVKNVMLVDLTQMFGTTIADYVYSLETATAGAGVAFFRSLFPADYYARNEGEETCVSAVNGNPYIKITIPLGQTVYGGTLDVSTGKLTVTHGEIASYNGEALPGEWISDRDVYAAETTPTIGAQVVYVLDTPQIIDLDPQQITTLIGDNNVWSDAGDVTLEYPYYEETEGY